MVLNEKHILYIGRAIPGHREEVLKCCGAYSNGCGGGCAALSSAEEQKAV